MKLSVVVSVLLLPLVTTAAASDWEEPHENLWYEIHAHDGDLAHRPRKPKEPPVTIRTQRPYTITRPKPFVAPALIQPRRSAICDMSPGDTSTYATGPGTGRNR